jgi:putative peptidoglycan lipid II flippase
MRVRGQTCEARQLAKVILFKMGLILVFLSVLGVLFADKLIYIVAGGFVSRAGEVLPTGETLWPATVKMVRIVLPYMFLTGIYSFYGSILVAKERFTVYSLSPALASLAAIVTILVLYGSLNFYAIGLSVIIGGIVQALINFIFAVKGDKKGGFNGEKVKKGEREVYRMMGPIFGDATVEKIATVVDIQMASFLAVGSISALDYGRLLFFLPFALLSLSVNRSIMPFLTHQNARNNIKEYVKGIRIGIRGNFMFAVPAAVGLFMLSREIVEAVYQRGAFNERAVSMTAVAVACYSVGLAGMAMTSLLSRAFYSILDSKTPFKISVFCLVLNIILNFLLWKTWLRHGGLALATSLAFTVNGLILFIFIKKRFKEIMVKDLLFPLAYYGFLSLIMAGLVWFVNARLGFNRYVHLGLVIVIGIGVYLVLMLAGAGLGRIRKQT